MSARRPMPESLKASVALYPCRCCGVTRTADEGGTTFTVCDECWDAGCSGDGSSPRCGRGTISRSHPEGTCDRCGGGNVCWFAPSPLWNTVARSHGYGILCPLCFIVLAEAQGLRAAWKIEPEPPTNEREAPDGHQ